MFPVHQMIDDCWCAYKHGASCFTWGVPGESVGAHCRSAAVSCRLSRVRAKVEDEKAPEDLSWGQVLPVSHVTRLEVKRSNVMGSQSRLMLGRKMCCSFLRLCLPISSTYCWRLQIWRRRHRVPIAVEYYEQLHWSHEFSRRSLSDAVSSCKLISTLTRTRSIDHSFRWMMFCFLSASFHCVSKGNQMSTRSCGGCGGRGHTHIVIYCYSTWHIQGIIFVCCIYTRYRIIGQVNIQIMMLSYENYHDYTKMV